jgi:isoquinoline 1-oxidoreductase subunit alpha
MQIEPLHRYRSSSFERPIPKLLDTPAALAYVRWTSEKAGKRQSGADTLAHFVRRLLMAVQFVLNGKSQTVDVSPQMPLLWVLRDTLGMTGTKFGCGMALCGACTVHIEGAATRSCITPVAAVAGKHITTIEGLSTDRSHPVQRAWMEIDVPQCGYCQSGQIMSASALLTKTPSPTDTQIDAAMAGNICRCGTYQRIREAIHRAAKMQAGADQGAAEEVRPVPEGVVAGGAQ